MKPLQCDEAMYIAGDQREIKLYARVWLHPVILGWRWAGGGLWYEKEWEEQDKKLSHTEGTRKVVLASMKGVISCLSFTTETSEDFPDRWIPTLDFKLRMRLDNLVEYTFYEKPTASDKCLQSDTALNHNCLIRSLANEVQRRLDNICSTDAT